MKYLLDEEPGEHGVHESEEQAHARKSKKQNDNKDMYHKVIQMIDGSTQYGTALLETIREDFYDPQSGHEASSSVCSKLRKSKRFPWAMFICR